MMTSERGERPYERIRVERFRAREKITLSYPARRNAIGPRMTNELLWALHDALEDDEVRVIVITGEGKSFSAGGDFAQMNIPGAPGTSVPPPDVTSLPVKGDYADLIRTVMRSEKPIIARVNGHALGTGLGLVAACTFSVALKGTQFGTPEINAGLFPMMVMSLLARRIPHHRLVELMLLGEKIDATEAARIGLIGQVVEPGELDETVRSIENQILHKSPLITRLGLRAYAKQDGLGFDEAMELMKGCLKEVLATEDAREGLTAFLEKREPSWVGR
jgi:enoyl-CoA hydratase/carnithine racemase